jgi:predicted O-linked N-acetylglucosamine transferase (SPINDLY family)
MADNETKFQSAVALLSAGDLQGADRLFKEILIIEPRHTGALNLLAVALMSLRRNQEAEQFAKRAVEVDQSSDATFYNYGLILKSLHRPQDALEQFNRALALNPSAAATWNSRGTVFNDLKQYELAISDFDKSTSLNPGYADAVCNKGKSLNELKRYDEALAACDKALALKNDLAEAWLGRGNALAELRRYDEAIASYDKAVAFKPVLAEAWLGIGNVFVRLKRHAEAFAAFDKALALQPELANAWFGRGNVFNDLKRHEEAANAYAMVLKLDPQHPFTKGRFLHQRMLSCNWKGVDALVAEIDDDIFSSRPSAEPFGWQGVSKSQRSLQLCAEIFNRETYPERAQGATGTRAANHSKIRVGYSSGELREQATSHLIVGVLEQHDRSRFEVYAIDNGWDDQSAIRKRINASVQKVIDIRGLTDKSAAAAITQNEIDILINLNGYFGEERNGVFAQRPAPIQVNYLGFPGTLAAPYMDYIIADEVVVPPDQKEFYTEKIVYLPNCYQANDRKKAIGTHEFTRVECGLPEKATVFCCFNNNYKILPDVFDTWMRILGRTNDSALWLTEDNAAAAENLRKEAIARGINAQRLVFAKRLPLADHLARHRLADLFLDTSPYNAHTTASDALWAGLPLLTQIGETFAGRVGASLLNAIGLPELIASTSQEYEALAIELANNPEKLAVIKEKLANNRLTTPLFDTQSFTRHLEAAYAGMFERYRANAPLDDIYVQP